MHLCFPLIVCFPVSQLYFTLKPNPVPKAETLKNYKNKQKAISLGEIKPKIQFVIKRKLHSSESASRF